MIPLSPPYHVQTGQTALYIASFKGLDQIVELLLKKEVDVNRQEKVRPLMLVCVFLNEKLSSFNVKNTRLVTCITINKVIIMCLANRLG